MKLYRRHDSGRSLVVVAVLVLATLSAPAADEKSFESTGNVAATMKDKVALTAEDALEQVKSLYASKQYVEAERQYRSLATQLQLMSHFSHPLFTQVLDGWALALEALSRHDEAGAARKLSKDIASGAVPKDWVGTVEMLRNGDILVRYRIGAPRFSFADAFLQVKPDKVAHELTVKHVGGLAVGQTKLLPPWPGVVPRLSNISCGIRDKNQIVILQESEYQYVGPNGIETLTVQNDPTLTTNHVISHALDGPLEFVSHSPEYRQAYLQDVTNLAIPDRVTLAFYLETGDMGPEEAFAALHTALRNSDAKDEAQALLLRSFPLTTAVVKARSPK